MSPRYTSAELAYSALRIVSGLLFLIHGLQKMFGVLGGTVVDLNSRVGAAGVIETVAGTLILVGLFTSVAAFIASGEMAVAYFLAHAPKAPMPIENGGELAVMFCFVFLYIAAVGDGRFSIGTAMFARRRVGLAPA